MWATTLWNHSTSYLQWGAVLGAALTGAVLDVRTGRIPNMLPAVVWVLGLIWGGTIGGPVAILDGVVGSLILILPYFLLFAFASGGAGDAKLMGALGAWLGVINSTAVLACVALSGVIVGLVYALARRRLRQVLGNIKWVVKLSLLRIMISRHLGELSMQTRYEPQKMPYGPAICIGVFLAAVGVRLWHI